MFFTLLFSEPILAVAWIAAVLSAITIHEFSHAFMAHLRGDNTAEAAGRLTLNPLSHIDITGFIAFLLIGYGWAKPVPFNPYYLKSPRWDGFLVAMAGPFSNLLLATLAGLLLRFIIGAEVLDSANLLVFFLFLVMSMNLGLLFFNLVPLPPLDGSKIWHGIFDTALHNPHLGQLIETRGQMVLMGLIFLSFAGVNVFFFLDYLVSFGQLVLLGSIGVGFF